MTPNMTCLMSIKDSEIDVESHNDLQAAMNELSSARNRCKEANKIALDITYQYCQLYVLAGCYGRALRT